MTAPHGSGDGLRDGGDVNGGDGLRDGGDVNGENDLDGGKSLADVLHEVEAAEHEYRPPAAGPVGNTVIAAVVLLFGIAALVGSWSLGVGSARVPEAGTWPLLVAVVFVALGVALLATVRRTTDAERFSRTSWLVLAGLATMVVFVAVIEHIGFEIPAALLAFVWLRFLGREGRRTSAAVSIGVVVAFYAVFVGALSVPIPHLF
ncbi:tripartite tricarboxylate transporter TctB family protein [Saccharothrix deserti]|uniref:tripartite tricarboxylate transporter TctB family protein n=1 Tax=Saccharothrix deserti TaxID=2593674 RepID=UPI00131EA2D6|nr:tripartite tricarboxylate transporter TctB family protein [Saccharothrix deserti]